MAFSLKEIFDAFGYTLSLPERLVRSITTILVGATKLLTDTIVPEPLRKSSTYMSLVGNAQRFLIERVAEVQGVYAAQQGQGLPDDFVARKVAGNVMEAAGMFSIHLSPLWVFAMASDVAQGSRVYLNRLTAQLKERGVLQPDADIDGLDGLLGALGQASQDSAKVFEAPPLNAAGLAELRDQITRGYKNVFVKAGDLAPRMDAIWGRVQEIASRENVAVESILGLMSLDVSRVAGKALDAAFAVGGTATDLVGETMLQSYAETIDRVQREGAMKCLAEAAGPFVDALVGHVSGDNATWTERVWHKLTTSLVGKNTPVRGEPQTNEQGSSPPQV